MRCLCDLFRYEGVDCPSPRKLICQCGHYNMNHEGGRYACHGRVIAAEKWKWWTRRKRETIRRKVALSGS